MCERLNVCLSVCLVLVDLENGVSNMLLNHTTMLGMIKKEFWY